MIRDAHEAGAWLESLINVEKRPDWPYARLSLAPIRGLLRRLGNPQQGLAAIHLAGSKGKGSTALWAEALLRAAGRRVGTYTSPHFERWTERVRLEGREVEGAQLAAAVEAVRSEVEQMREAEPDHAPTFFDALTAAALLCFRDAGIETAVLEVGLGGRLDSTNVVLPRVACVTSIELEHTDKLGSTLAAIAGEKAGILKPGVPAVVGELPEEALAVVEARAAEIGVPLSRAGRDFRVRAVEQGRDGLRVRFEDGDIAAELRLPVLGAHQAGNAALALACVRRMGGISEAALAEAATLGFAGARLPGRIEILGSAPLRIVDSAHTRASARALAAVLAELPRRRTHLVLSVSAGKDLGEILDALLPLTDELSVTRAEATRSLAPAEVAAAAARSAPGLHTRVVPNPHLALRAAVEAAAPEDCVCATGSVYLAGIARRVLAAPAPARGLP